MTEDDTFLALRKPSYAEMYQLWANSDLIKLVRGAGPWDKYATDVDKFFRRHGWTTDEYSNYHDRG